MTELKVVLDFACCLCDNSMSVTVQCAGKGLMAGARTVAAVNVPCPTCGGVNHLCFEPSGTVRAVTPHRSPRGCFEPSMN